MKKKTEIEEKRKYDTSKTIAVCTKLENKVKKEEYPETTRSAF